MAVTQPETEADRLSRKPAQVALIFRRLRLEMCGRRGLVARSFCLHGTTGQSTYRNSFEHRSMWTKFSRDRFDSSADSRPEDS